MSAKRNCLALLTGAVLLAGCGDGDVQEVNQWMEQTKKETKVDVKPLTEPTTFVPFAYSTVGQVDPYDPNKLLAELARSSTANNPLKPDDNRPKEVLEAFPLDTMSMVGSMKSKGVMYALVQIDKTMYHVKPGDRVGQNFGIITGVSDEAISIKETVQDAGGEWIERPTKLELQESKEKK